MLGLVKTFRAEWSSMTQVWFGQGGRSEGLRMEWECGDAGLGESECVRYLFPFRLSFSRSAEVTL